MLNKFSFLGILISLSACLSSVAFCDTEGGTSEATVTTSNRSPSRFFRRLIVEGSYENAGFEGDNSTRYSRPNGYSAGVLFDLLGRGGLVLETGALYRQFGTTYNNGLGDNSLTANYISVPIDLKYYFSGQEGTSLYIKAGVMGSTLTSSNTTYETPTTQVGARAWETAYIGGLGFKFNLAGNTDMLIEADYSRSTERVFDNSNYYRSDLSAAVGLAVNL